MKGEVRFKAPWPRWKDFQQAEQSETLIGLIEKGGKEQEFTTVEEQVIIQNFRGQPKIT